jgi:hypothetical protein
MSVSGRRSRQDHKFETRNSKQFQMTKKHEIPNKIVSDFDFLSFGLIFFALFRISNFGFRILNPVALVAMENQSKLA